ncbi:MAG: hypothetical protein LBO82_01380 [Synergistaceae bacterium]|jgi:hypothetical protein|nr:hypothetical protein [Synergistaceae bacterium]
MAFKAGAASYLFKYIWPPSVFAEARVLFREWQRSGVRNKAILGVFFIPAMLSLGGLLLCVAYFVLFKLPSFILSVLGWLLLTSLFSGGGLFCYEKLVGKRPSETRRAESYDYDAEAAAEDVGPDMKEKAKKWFDGIRHTK